MKQTAVEWLIEHLTEIHPEAFEQSKQMEMEQIIDAFDYGDSNLFIDKDGEQYYNETFKSE